MGLHHGGTFIESSCLAAPFQVEVRKYAAREPLRDLSSSGVPSRCYQLHPLCLCVQKCVQKEHLVRDWPLPAANKHDCLLCLKKCCDDADAAYLDCSVAMPRNTSTPTALCDGGCLNQNNNAQSVNAPRTQLNKATGRCSIPVVTNAAEIEKLPTLEKSLHMRLYFGCRHVPTLDDQHLSRVAAAA